MMALFDLQFNIIVTFYIFVLQIEDNHNKNFITANYLFAVFFPKQKKNMNIHFSKSAE